MELSDEAREAKNRYQREWRKKNRERWNAYQREWKKNNPEKVKEHTRRHWERKAAELENEDPVTEKACPVCGESIEGRKKYCSDACKMRAYRLKNKAS